MSEVLRFLGFTIEAGSTHRGEQPITYSLRQNEASIWVKLSNNFSLRLVYDSIIMLKSGVVGYFTIIGVG